MPLKVKDTLRATVHLTFDGRVIKAYHGPKAEERFAQETKILKFLEKRGCPFVPRLLEADREAPTRWELLQTPFSRAELARGIARVIGERHAGG